MKNIFHCQLHISGKKSIIFLFVILFLIITSYVNTLSCDKVAALPKDFNLLLPQYEKLKRVHLLNYFFLEDIQDTAYVANHNANFLAINLKEQSVFKIQITPKHIGIEVTMMINSEKINLEASPGMPLDYSSYLPINPGLIEISFIPVSYDDEGVFSKLKHKTINDEICDSPYMQLEIYFEEYQHLKGRLPHVKKEVDKLEDFDLDFNDILKSLAEYEEEDPDSKVRKLKRNLDSYKLILPHTRGLQYYQNYNISVIREYELNFVEDQMVADNQLNSTESATPLHINHKLFIKLQIYSDFFLGGSFYFLLIRSADFDKLNNYECLQEGSCFLSDRTTKSTQVLEAILTPGSYKILLVDFNMINYFVNNASIYSLRKSLKLDYIPISTQLTVKYFKKSENRFNCIGRHLPKNFDYLIFADGINNYFEYKGDILMNFDKLHDEVEFTVEEDSMMRLITFYPEGNHIEIQLHEVKGSEYELNKLISLKGSRLSGFISDLVNKINIQKKLDKLEETIISLSKNSGESDGLVMKLLKGVRYKLVFNYQTSFFEENERKLCEMFYLKLAISKISFLKSIVPTTCSSISKLKSPDIEELIKNLEDNHHKKEEYDFTTKNTISSDMNLEDIGSILYNQSFEIKQAINLNVEVISEFISSYITPIVIPLKDTNINIRDVVNKKYKKLIFHENSIKLKLNKGKYMLILINGLSQYNTEENGIHKTIPYYLKDLLKCVSFKLRIATVRLNNRKMMNWECNFIHYDQIPNILELSEEKREKFTYFNNNLLVPGANKNSSSRIMKIHTGNQGYFLRLIAEYKDKNEFAINSNKYFEITLNKGKKVMRKAKENIIDYDITTDQIYLNFYLNPDTQYELKFETLKSGIDGWNFFEYCRTFKLEMNFIRQDFIKNSSKINCIENFPKNDDVIYERLIDVNNSFYKYGSNSFINLIKPNKKDSHEMDLQVTHPNGSQFTFKYRPEQKHSGKNLKNTFSIDFEVKSVLSLATIIIENESIIGISAKLLERRPEGTELLAAEDLEDQGLLTIRGVLLKGGKYTVTFFANTYSDKNIRDLISDQCVTFSASILLENKPFDFFSKGIGGYFQTCPYPSFPENLNIPGWIHADTDYTLNEYSKFKISMNNNVKRFSIREKSIFKFFLPEDSSNIVSYISLYRIKSNQNQKLIEKLEKENNYLNSVLEKGTYQLNFNFKISGSVKINESDEKCSYYEVYISIIPLSNIKDGTISFDTASSNSKNECEEKLINYNNELKVNTYIEHSVIQFPNIQGKDWNTEETPQISLTNAPKARKIKILPATQNGKFIAELIFNHYIDDLYELVIFKIDSHSQNDSKYIAQPSELIIYENFMWITFHFEKNTEYILEIIPANFNNISVCSSVVFSYNYEEYLSNLDGGIEEEYLNKKDSCQVEDHLPANFFSNKNNILQKYGGPQSEITGEINFLGEFLIPKSFHQLRSEFFIMQKSTVFIKIIPKYSHVQASNIRIQIFREHTVLYNYSHSENKGILLTELDINTYSKNVQPGTYYYLDITFDKLLSDCESFEFIFTIIPRNLYIDNYLSCDENREDLPDTLTFDKTSQYSYVSLIQMKENKFSKDDIGNLFKSIRMNLPKPTSLTILLEYIVSDNSMDIIIEEDPLGTNSFEYKSEPIEIGIENFQQAPNVNGITSRKEIIVNLKKGNFILKLIYHKFFSDLLKKQFEKEFNYLCVGFELNIEAVILKDLKTDSYDEKEDDKYDPELNHLTRSDFAGTYANVVISVNPPEMKNIRLNGKFVIEIKFAYDLDLTDDKINNNYYLKLIYLQDINKIQNGIKIFPIFIEILHKNEIKYIFDSTQLFEVLKCYKLYIDDDFKSKFDVEAIRNLNHIFCTINCDCNQNSNFKCSKSGTCICHPPYNGMKCEKCTEGYIMNNGKCLDKKLHNTICEEKFTCSGNGKCSVKTFDAYTITFNQRDGPCKCSEGFASYNSPKGYPTTTFCNTCSNPIKIFPKCGANNGEEFSDSLSSTLDSNCNEAINELSLPSRLYESEDDIEDNSALRNPILEAIGNGQDTDGSLDLLAVFKVASSEENTEIIIPEDSIIRVFYETHDINRAKISLFDGKYETDAIAYTNGKDKTESFIARLEPKSTSYYIKIMHSNLKYGCNRYRLKIAIRPIKLLKYDLKCNSKLNINDQELLLPPTTFILNNTAQVFGEEKIFYIPDYLVLNPSYYNNEEQLSNKEYHKDYTKIGIITKGYPDEEFEFNIKLDVRSPVTVGINVLYDFISSDISLILRDSTGKYLIAGDWLIPNFNVHIGDNKFINTLSKILDPGYYFLTVIQNIPSNHLLQIIYDEEIANKSKTKKKLNSCFKFSLHIQTTPINKPDPALSTSKFESMYNRIVSVEPESSSNVNIGKKFELFVNFEDSISSSLKLQSNINNPSFKDVFYLENSRNHEKLTPTHAYLQGSLSKTFLIIYDEYVMAQNECYELKYNLELLQSNYDKERKVTSDSPLVHKFCTKNCNCNPHTYFECELETGKCICEEPYTGEGCLSCIEGWYMARGKCISAANCSKNFCSGFGNCNNSSISTSQLNKAPSCICYSYFTGNDCSSCVSDNEVFPDCIKLDESYNSSDTKYEAKFLSDKNEQFNELDFEKNKCEHTFLPHNLDTLGYLHLNGNMHISGKYSLKHINNKYYSMIFTLKEKSHVKIFLEHSKSTHILSMFLLDNNKKLLHQGSIHYGPSGIGTSSLIDFIVDPLRDPKDNSYVHYEVNFYMKNISGNNDEISLSYQEESDLSNISNECFTIFLEMQIMTLNRENNIISNLMKEQHCAKKQESKPYLVPVDIPLVDMHTVYYNSINISTLKFTHIRDSMKLHEINFFHYEYFYAPDQLDLELILDIEVYSKFINSHVGILLEIVEIPIEDIKIDHKKLFAKTIDEILEKKNKKKVEFPECLVHCFSGIKKFNSVLVSRILPSDTFFRIWFYDLSPLPKDLSLDNLKNDKLFNYCVDYEISLTIRSAKANDSSIKLKKEASLCVAQVLPHDLNIKDYLGDPKYLKKWGFHILDYFRIDHSIDTGLVHEMLFEIKQYTLLRLVVFHGRVDTDLELFFKQGNEDILIARSNSKNFEDVLVIEIPPGSYKLIFKFFPPSSGFHKCESIKMEFSMNPFHLIQQNIDRMVARHKNNPIFNTLDFYEHVSRVGKDIFEKDISSVRYTTKISEPFTINQDNPKLYEASIVISQLKFVVEQEDSGKLELIAYVNSDFLLLDANIYLSLITTGNSDSNSDNSKIIAGTHKKNMNLLFSGPLEAGTYLVTLRYYRRLHYKIPNDSSFKDVMLFRSSFAELEFDSIFVNKSNKELNILTSGGYITIPPKNLNKSSISHNWLCRHSALPIPKSLSSLRYFEFNSDVHILDNFLVPPMGTGEEVIKFKLKHSPNTMIRVYVECHSINIDIELREKNGHNEYKTIATSKESIHFESIMQIISDDKEYEIVLQFKGENNESYSNIKISDPNQSCLTFKMEIALESSHNYACPDSDKYTKLSELNVIPQVLPVKLNNNSKIYRYDSKKIYKGDDKNSGYVYMIRTENDQVFKWSKFIVKSDIDFKVEISFDFMQAPVNIFLTHNDIDSAGLYQNNLLNKNKDLKNALGLNDAFIISYGEIFENRTTLVVNNLPKGSYTIYIFLTGLKTKFLHEPRVCSIYDVLVEAKKSRYHFKEKEIINTAEIEDDNLDLPVKLPSTLNNLKYLEHDENYINQYGLFFFNQNKTIIENQNYDMYNTIEFTLKEESVVQFYVSHDILKEKLQVAIDGYSHFGEYTSAVLKSGFYKAVVKVENSMENLKFGFDNDVAKRNDIFRTNSFSHLLLLYIGISPANRVKEIYNYNNLLSSYHQCKSMKFPQDLENYYDKITHSYKYHFDMFTFNREDLRNLKLGQFNVNLNKSNNYRIIAEIGADYVLNKMSLLIKSQNKLWATSWMGNVGDLDISVPSGTYLFELEIDEKILLENLDCLIFTIDIHIVDKDYLSTIPSDLSHPLYLSHVFDSASRSKSQLLSERCDGSVLPLELHGHADTEYHKIKENGEYFLHLQKANYFISKQHSQNGENLNEVDINLLHMSLVRITTIVEKPNEFQVIPKLKLYSKIKSTDNHYIPANLHLVSHNLKERNSVWFLEQNKDEKDEFYTLELLQEKYEEYTQTSLSYHCPYYTLDILIQSVKEIANKMECLKQNNSNDLLEYLTPKREIEFLLAKSYHEKIEYSYFTEKQYGEYYVDHESFSGLQYSISFEITAETEYYLSLNFGYNLLLSLFDVYLSKYEENAFQSSVIAVSEVYFDKGSEYLPYKRILNSKISKGKYVLLVVENIWHELNANIKSYAESNANTRLCLPFSYSLDIIPANDKTSAPEIISVFPPGPIAFKSIEEDLNIKIVLSKPAFTRKHEPITYLNNIMNIIYAFYLTKSPTKGKNVNTNFNEINSKDKIHPSKLEGSENNKEWNLLFMKHHFEPNYDYQLHLDSSWLYDVNYSEFKPTKQMPIIRVETNKEAIFNFVDNIKNMKDKMNDSGFKIEKETPPSSLDEVKTKDTAGKDSLTSSKCGKHGKEIYDNILQRQACTCYDGYTGKFCTTCEGIIDKTTEKCIIIDDGNDDEPDNEPISEPIINHIGTSSGDIPQNMITGFTPPKTEHKSCDGGCVHGYCDSKTGKCVCDINYFGLKCEKEKSQENEHYKTAISISNYGMYLQLFLKVIIGVFLLILLYYFYNFIKTVLKKKKAADYDPVPTTEFEMSIGSKSINNVDRQNLELMSSDSQHLVDYEIKNEANNKYRRTKKAKEFSAGKDS